jgi:hypothetical protein
LEVASKFSGERKFVGELLLMNVAAVQKHGPHKSTTQKWLKTLLIQRKTSKAVLAIHLQEFIEADSFCH